MRPRLLPPGERLRAQSPFPPPSARSGSAHSRDSAARLAAAVALAKVHGTVLSSREVAEIAGPETAASIEPADLGLGIPDEALRERWTRSERFRTEGSTVTDIVLRPVAGLMRCIGITGSTAYGAPVRGDDLDFLAVVRRGGVWPFLLFVWLAARWKRVESPDGPRGWCFNMVLDEREARREFAQPRGFLVARDALMMQPLLGASYYEALLRASPWLEGEIPVLYRERTGEATDPIPSEAPLPLLVRGTNLVLYPWMATYLQLVALYESARHRRAGRDGRAFRVLTTPTRSCVFTEEFDQLEKTWRAAASAANTSVR